MNSHRIAWLLTSSKYYWHPALSAFACAFPQMKAFAPNWTGYAQGCEEAFAIEIFAKPKIIPLTASATGYGSNFTYLPLGVVSRLLRFRPALIFANSFGIWTLLALLLKPIGRWKVVIAYEGSSPGVDYRNSPPRLALRRAMVRAADACITNTQAGSAYLTQVLKAPPDRVFAHPYELTTAEALGGAAVCLPFDRFQRPVFLYVGRIIPRKGLRCLLQACLLLDQLSFTVLVIGEGAQQPELEAFCQQQGLSDRVHWLGSIDHSQLGSYYSQADAFVLPTLEDTWGMVVLEAMVFGKPVLCSQQAGAAELVVSGENGFCFDPHHPAELADRMRQLIQQPALMQTMGQKARQTIARYTPSAAGQFLADVAARVLEASP